MKGLEECIDCHMCIRHKAPVVCDRQCVVGRACKRKIVQEEGSCHMRRMVEERQTIVSYTVD